MRAFAVLAGFGITFYIGNTMGPTANGQYALVTQTAFFLSAIVVGGLDLTVVREFSATIAKNIKVQRRSLARTFLLSIGLAGIAIFIMLLGGDQLFLKLVGDNPPKYAFFALCILLVMRAIIRICSAFLRSQQFYLLGQTIESLIIPLSVLLAIIVGFSRSIEEILWFTAGVAILAASIGMAFSFMQTSKNADALTVPVRRMLRTALPLWGITITLAFSEWYGLATVASVNGVYDAGIYRTAIQVGGAMAIVSSGLFSVFSPQISAAAAAGNLSEVGRITRAATRLSVALETPATITLLIFAGPILALIGPEFRAGENVLRIIIIGQAIFSMTGPSGLTLALTGHERANFWVTACGLAALLIAAPIAAYLGGIVAVAGAISILLVGRNIVSLWLVRRLTGINVITGNYRPKDQNDG